MIDFEKKEFVYFGKDDIGMNCDVLFTIELDNKNYIFYTDRTIDDDGYFRTYVASYLEDEDNRKCILFDIEDDITYEKLQKIFDMTMDAHENNTIDSFVKEHS